MNYATYDEIEAVRWSELRRIGRSPLHYHDALQNVTDTAAMALGRAVHTSVFEPDSLPLEYAVWTGGRRGTNEYKEWVEQQGERQILSESEYATCLAIRDAVRAHPVAAKLLAEGEAESVVTWRDTETSLSCKARLDWVSDSCGLVDLKTATSIDKRDFANAAARYDYFGQLAFYRMGIAANGCDVGDSTIIAVESARPHDVAVFRIPEESLWAGEDRAHEYLRTLADCLATDMWPGAFPEAETLDAPDWYFPNQDEQDELAVMAMLKETS